MNYNGSTYIYKIIFNDNRSFNSFPGPRDLNFGPEIVRKLRIFEKMGSPRSIISIIMDCIWFPCRCHVRNSSDDFYLFAYILRSLRPPFRAINDKNRRFYQKIRRLEVEELDLNRFFPIIRMKQSSLYINHSSCHLSALVQRLVDPHLVEHGRER